MPARTTTTTETSPVVSVPLKPSFPPPISTTTPKHTPNPKSSHSPLRTTPGMSVNNSFFLPSSSSSSLSPSAGGPTTNAEATLKSIYPRAAKAFIHKNMALCHTLLESAFTLLPPPCPPLRPDTPSLAALRRKYEMLRVTMETTLYASGHDGRSVDGTSSPYYHHNIASSGNGSAAHDLPTSLRANLLHSPPSFLANLTSRSIRLFAPSSSSSSTSGSPIANGYAQHSNNGDISPSGGGGGANVSAAYIPAQALNGLLHAAIKIECLQEGRALVDGWLAARQNLALLSEYGESERTTTMTDEDDLAMYMRVMETYVFTLLPRLGEWEYARDLVRYDTALSEEQKQKWMASLQNAREQAEKRLEAQRKQLAAAATTTTPAPPASASSASGLLSPHSGSSSPRRRRRSRSSSTSSSVSSASTHTARPGPRQQSMASSTSSLHSTATTITPHSYDPAHQPHDSSSGGGSNSSNNKPGRSKIANGSASYPSPYLQHSISSSSSSGAGPTTTTTSTSRAVSTASVVVTIVRTHVASILRSRTRISVTLLVFAVVVPILTWVLRLVRRRGRPSSLLSLPPTTTTMGLVSARSATEDAKRRLAARQLWWKEILLSLVDAVRMGTQGLV